MKKRNVWTKREIKLIKEHYGSISLNELKARYLPSRHTSTTYNKAKSLGLKGFQSKPRIKFNTAWTPELAYFAGLIASDGCIQVTI